MAMMLIGSTQIEQISDAMGVTTVKTFLPTYHLIRKQMQLFKEEYDELNRTILEYWHSQRMNISEIERRVRVVEELTLLTSKVCPSGRLILMGSTVTQCGLSTCDLDLCLAIYRKKLGYDRDRQYERDILSTLESALQNSQTSRCSITSIKFIPATVAILKCTVMDELGEIEVDINCNNLAGVYNSYLLHHYARLDNRFPMLCMIVKRWSDATFISDAMNGFFNSYSIKMLVLHFLQCAVWPPILPNLRKIDPNRFGGIKYNVPLEKLQIFDRSPELPPGRRRNCKTVAELLMAFFDYYARFDFENQKISMPQARVLDRERPFRGGKVEIEGPFDHENTARTVKSEECLELIKDAFQRASHAYLGPAPIAPTFNEITTATY